MKFIHGKCKPLTLAAPVLPGGQPAGNQLCTDLGALVDKLNTSQQHALVAKMANSTLDFI